MVAAATIRCAFSGVWRFHELLPFAPPRKVVTIGEGQTLLQPSDGVGTYVGMQAGRLFLQYEGMNPSGSFKDNGMTAAFTHAHMIGATRAACASTGNTSASLALYCAVTRADEGRRSSSARGKISYGKLSQALDYGALTVQIAGDFDDAMHRVQASFAAAGHLSRQQRQSVPARRAEDDHVSRAGRRCAGKCPIGSSCPAATSATRSAFGKAFAELHELGLIDRMPRLAVINAAGANTLYRTVRAARPALERRPAGHVASSISYYAELDAAGRRASTIASAIEINRPVNLDQMPAGAGSLRRRRPRSDRPGDSRRQGPSRRRRLRLRAGQRRERRRREAAASPKASSAATSASSASSPAINSKTRPRRSPITRPIRTQFNKVLGSRGVKRAPIRQPRRGGEQRPRRNHQGDSALQLGDSGGQESGDVRSKQTHDIRSAIAIHGAAGRMGQRLDRAGLSRSRTRRSSRARSAGTIRGSGQDAGTIAGVGEIGVPLPATLDAPVDVVIDFSVPAGARRSSATCVERGCRWSWPRPA